MAFLVRLLGEAFVILGPLAGFSGLFSGGVKFGIGGFGIEALS